MHDTPFGLSDDEMDEYRQRFDGGAPTGPQIFFNGIPLRPIGGIIMFEGTPAPLAGRTSQESAALRYVWRRISAGREYISLRRMSRELALPYDMCENFITKFHAERVIPRLPVVEEVEG